MHQASSLACFYASAMLRRVSHPAEGVTHRAIEVPCLEVELMTDAAVRAVVPDNVAPCIHPVPALRPCADIGILHEQPQWVDLMVRKPEPVGNGVEVPPDPLSLHRPTGGGSPTSRHGATGRR